MFDGESLTVVGLRTNVLPTRPASAVKCRLCAETCNSESVLFQLSFLILTGVFTLGSMQRYQVFFARVRFLPQKMISCGGCREHGLALGDPTAVWIGGWPFPRARLSLELRWPLFIRRALAIGCGHAAPLCSAAGGASGVRSGGIPISTQERQAAVRVRQHGEPLVTCVR